MYWGRLISHIHDNAVEIEVHLLPRISSLCVNIKKFARYICVRTQRTLCVTSSITMKSQTGGSTALANYSIFPLKFTTINVLWKYMKNVCIQIGTKYVSRLAIHSIYPFLTLHHWKNNTSVSVEVF